MAANGNLIFQDTNKATFVGANSNVVIDTVNASFGVGVDVNGPTSNLHVVGNAYVTSDLEVGTANLFVDTVNSRVGVGTTTPSDALHVYGSPMIQHDTTYDFANNQGWYKIGVWDPTNNTGARLKIKFLGMEGYSSQGIARGGETILYASCNNNMPDTKANIDGRLHAYGDPAITQVKFIHLDNSNSRHKFEIRAFIKTFVQMSMTVECTQTESFTKDVTASTDPGGDSSTVSHAIFTHVINNAGNVGIGTTNPTNSLHVYKDGAEATSGLFIEKANSGIGTAASLLFGTNAAGENAGIAKAGIFFQRTATYGRGDFQFCLDNVDDATPIGLSNSKMTIKSDGNVGIGESSPAELVHIRGTGPHILIEGASNENGQIDFSSGPSYRNSRHQIESLHYALSGNGYRNWLAFRVNEGGESTPTTRMVIRGDGNVGIGTTSPLARIDARINDGVSSSNWVSGAFGPATGSLSRTVIGTYNSCPVIGGHNSNLSGWDKLVINPTNQGNVGVGTFTPLRKLHVEPSMMVANNTTGSALLVDNSAQSAGLNDYSYILNAPRPGTISGGAVHFINSAGRSDDGGVSSYNIRNDSGPLILGHNTHGLTSICGSSVHRSAGNSSSIIYGPNAAHGCSLTVGATTGGGFGSNDAGVVTTNGNLHLDAGASRNTYLNYYSGASVIFGNGASGTGVGIFTSGGLLGVGTTNPTKAKLHVVGSVSTSLTAQYYNSSGDSASVGPQNRTLSGYFSSHLACDELQVFSDRRIKTEIEDIDDGSALELFRQIQPKTYKYLDKAERGNERVYGFVAQEIKELMPEAVDVSSGKIPNIYEVANVSNSNVITFTHFNTSNLVSNSNILEVQTVHGDSQSLNIAEVVDEHVIRVDEDLSDWIGSVDESGNVASGNQLFVYGQEVNDFHHLKKSAIWTVTTAALQEVDRQQQVDKVRISELETRLASVLTRLDALENAS